MSRVYQRPGAGVSPNYRELTAKFTLSVGFCKWLAGLNQRTVVIAFDSLAQATATHDSPGYQAALAALGDGAERDIRLVEGV